MKFKFVAVSLIIIYVFINFLTFSPQILYFKPKYKEHSYNLSALESESDARSNITLAEDLIFANFDIILGTELNNGDIWYLYLGLASAIQYLNEAQSALYNKNNSTAINKAKKAQSIAQGMLPLSLLKGIESVSNKEFMNIIFPVFITIIIISIILGVILLLYAKKSYYRKKDEKDLLKKKIIISNNEIKGNK